MSSDEDKEAEDAIERYLSAAKESEASRRLLKAIQDGSLGNNDDEDFSNDSEEPRKTSIGAAAATIVVGGLVLYFVFKVLQIL